MKRELMLLGIRLRVTWYIFTYIQLIFAGEHRFTSQKTSYCINAYLRNLCPVCRTTDTLITVARPLIFL